MSVLPSWLASGQGDTPLLLLHGMGSTASIWLPQLEHFAGRRQTIAWTMPGYAPSPAPASLSWQALADAVCKLLDAWQIDKAHVLGHSIGGMVAQEFYHRYPQRVQSLMLSATSAAFGSTDADWTAEFLRQRTEAMRPYERFSDAAPAMLSGFTGPRASPGMRALAELSASNIDKQRYLEAMRLLVTFDRRAEFPDIAVPLLLLAGELDTQAPPKGMKRLAKNNANACFQQLPGLSHMANIESPHLFNEAVDAFLTAQQQVTPS